MDGMEVLKEIRANKESAELPVMIVTNTSDAQTLYESTDLTRYFFTKAGWDLNDLIKEVVGAMPRKVSQISHTEEDKNDIKKALNLGSKYEK